MHIDWLSLGTLLLITHVLGGLAACHAILNTRTSQGAIAWAISLLSVPYFTLIPYLFLGRSKFAGYIVAHRRENEWMHHRARPDSEARHPAGARPAEALGNHAIRALTRMTGMPFLPGNHVALLCNGAATFAAIFDAIERAQRYILVQFFIVRDDALGRRLQELLVARVKAGVRVYFLYDSIGCFNLPRRYTGALRAAGVEVHAFATRRRFVNRLQVNFRNHRKIVVVDGECAFIGGHNVGVEYLGEIPPLSPWRDTHVEVRGPVVESIQFIFLKDWYWATQRLPETDGWNVSSGTDMHCQITAPGPADRQETGSLFFVELINAARHRLWITTPYLVPDEAVFSALRLAAMRGVDVRILLPARRDHVVVFAASKLYAYDAIDAGVKIYRYRPGFLHQKVVLIDNHAAAIGSANLDNRSFRLNFEIMLLTVDHGFAAQVKTMLDADFAQAYLVDHVEVAKASAVQQMGMHIARLFSPIL